MQLLQNKALQVVLVDAAGEAAFLVLKVCQCCWNRQVRQFVQLVNHCIFIAGNRFFCDGFEHARAELIRACSGCNQGLCGVASCLAVILINLDCNSSMGIAGITIGFINLMNGCLGSSIIAESAEEVLLEGSLNGIGHFISTGFRQSGEPFPNLCIVFAGQQVQQPFQIAGNQNRSGCHEIS